MRGKVGTAVRFEHLFLLTGSGGLILGNCDSGFSGKAGGLFWFGSIATDVRVFFKGMLQLELDVDVDVTIRV